MEKEDLKVSPNVVYSLIFQLLKSLYDSWGKIYFLKLDNCGSALLEDLKKAGLSVAGGKIERILNDAASMLVEYRFADKIKAEYKDEGDPRIECTVENCWCLPVEERLKKENVPSPGFCPVWSVLELATEEHFNTNVQLRTFKIEGSRCSFTSAVIKGKLPFEIDILEKM